MTAYWDDSNTGDGLFSSAGNWWYDYYGSLGSNGGGSNANPFGSLPGSNDIVASANQTRSAEITVDCSASISVYISMCSVYVSGSGTIYGGDWTGAGSIANAGTISGGTVILASNTGTVSGGTITLAPGMSNAGTFSYGSFSGSGWTNNGTINGGSFTSTSGGLTNGSTGVISGYPSFDSTVALTNYGTVHGGTFYADCCYNYLTIDGGTFSGNAFTNGSGGTISGGSFSGSYFTNSSTINGGSFSGYYFTNSGTINDTYGSGFYCAGFTNTSMSYINGGYFACDTFVNVGTIYGGTFSGSGFNNSGTIVDGTFSNTSFVNNYSGTGGNINGGTFTATGFDNTSGTIYATQNYVPVLFTGDSFTLGGGSLGQGGGTATYAPIGAIAYATLIIAGVLCQNPVGTSGVYGDPGFVTNGCIYAPIITVTGIPISSDIIGAGLL